MIDTYTWGLNSEPIQNWAWNPVFNKAECEFIIGIGNGLGTVDGTVIKIDGNVVDSNIRKSNVNFIPVQEHTKWIFERCTAAVNDINQRYFNFDLCRIQSLQFTSYDEQGSFYGKHNDQVPVSGTSDHRKLSFSIQLSSPDSYEGGDLELHYTTPSCVAKRDLGIATFFPSYCLHEVTPVTSGIRYSLVGWVVGPRFK
jgi:PKHD-type hydroxylase